MPVGFTPAPSPAISVLICTRNRAAQLGRTLESLTRMDGVGSIVWELIIADNASTDGTVAVAHSFVDRLPLRVVTATLPGLSYARNAALNAATAPFILFTDDDCLVGPEWLRTAMDLFARQPDRLIAGRVELHDPDDLPLAIKVETEAETLSDYSDILGFLHGANMGFPRTLIERLGFFDTRLGAGTRTRSAEDADLVYRAFIAGVPVCYEPDLMVSHHHGRRGARAWRHQNADYAQGVGAMAVKYLLRGDIRPLRIAYWDFMSAFRLWRRDRSELPRLIAKLSTLRGFVTYHRTTAR